MDGIILPLREQLIGVSFDLTPVMTLLPAILYLLFLLPSLVSSQIFDVAALGKKVIEMYVVPHFGNNKQPRNYDWNFMVIQPARKH